ncbi:hypothetical protein [Polluticoccus soli]|uniref:hypothetical protein n=2 Tax=Chitinophagaceae TaxID=563835 RepID=UPI0023E21CD9|nr:hypothetical protein [Flavipsychrobacter sp. JY13-12]
MDTIVLKWYKAGSNFSQQTNEQHFYLDSTAKAMDNSNYYAVALDKSAPTDSLRLLRLFYLNQVPDGNTAADFELFIPANNRTYRVSDILLDGDYKIVQSHACSKAPSGGFCYRHIVSHKIDGVSVNKGELVIQK